MAGPKGSKYYNVFLEYEVWLTADGAELVEAFSQLHKEFDEAIYRTTKKFFHDLNKLP